MTHDLQDEPSSGPDATATNYEPPTIEFLGTVDELTGGPNPGHGDVPAGVISF